MAGTRGCLSTFLQSIGWLSDLTANATRRFLVDLTASIEAWNVPGGESTRGGSPGGDLPNAQVNARHEFCSRAMRNWVRHSQPASGPVPASQGGAGGGAGRGEPTARAAADGTSGPRSRWEWADRFAMSWLSPEWAAGAVHYSAQPVVVLLGDAFCRPPHDPQ